ncbi:TRAP transporter small permease [Denitromonas iodatirespirans]|uniref:TRAP transporter small permease protein n=1 Tax=Denitromonas iodatirespirans TaxID=2795389 RepID=A0A944HDP4_DENI1|nr:TRAP transporter small permease [Denitromonas iodatirespirans]MBT0963952.1 TRAP transporter small permease [Denitromonas iodatirespirans]
MRHILNTLYRLSGALAAVGMVATLVMVTAGIVTRPLGIYLEGSDDYAGYAMAACGFLALAYTFKHGEHIRVTLLIDRIGGAFQRSLQWIALLVGCAVSAALAWYSLRLAWQSHAFGELSQGVDATPLWLPQLSLAIGATIFFIAMLDDLVMTTLGRPCARLAQPGQEPVRME